MRLETAVAKIDAMFPAVTGLPTNRCQTGEHYVTLGIAGPVPESTIAAVLPNP